MASNEENESHFSTEDRLYMERYAYDVLSQLLPIFDFPKTKIPATNRKENTYHLENFLMIAVTTVLPAALLLRNKLLRYFNSRYESAGFDDENLPKYLKSILEIECRNDCSRRKFIVSLALYTEIVMFHHYKDIEIDFDRLTHSWSLLVMQFIEKNNDISETMEQLLDSKMMNFMRYIMVISVFVNKLGVPYGSQSNISRCFCIFLCEMIFSNVLFDLEKEESLRVIVQHIQDVMGSVPFFLDPTRLTKKDKAEDTKCTTVSSKFSQRFQDSFLPLAARVITSDVDHEIEDEEALKKYRGVVLQERLGLVQDRLGFVPHEMTSAHLTEKEKISFAENIKCATESVLPGNRVSPEPPTDSASCRRNTLVETNVSELPAQRNHISQKSAVQRADDISGQVGSATENVPQKSRGAIPKRKVRDKKKKNRT